MDCPILQQPAPDSEEAYAAAAQRWKEEFDPLIQTAFKDAKANSDAAEKAKKKYKHMRNQIAQSVAAAPWPVMTAFPDAVEDDDPLAWASHLNAPLLVSFHHGCQQHIPEGDLGSECLRRCKFHWLGGEASAAGVVLRAAEETGYRQLHAAWPLTVIALPQPRQKNQSLDHKIVYNDAKILLVTTLQQADTSDSVVLNGLPFTSTLPLVFCWMLWRRPQNEPSWWVDTGRLLFGPCKISWLILPPLTGTFLWHRRRLLPDAKRRNSDELCSVSELLHDLCTCIGWLDFQKSF